MRRALVAFIILLLATVSVPVTANAFTPFKVACSGGGASSAVCTDSKTVSTTDPIQTEIGDATHVVAIIGGVVAIIIMLIGAIRYINSGGDSNAVSSAKNTILYAAVGIVVIVLSQSLIVFVVDRI
jgi:hypothetical protein